MARGPKVLAVVRAGDRSLHPFWLGGPRSFDLMVSHFGDGPIAREADCIQVERVKGPKWQPLHDLLDRQWDTISAYDYVWLPDDDLMADAPTLARFFAICGRENFELAQPALTADSYFSHFITLRRRGLSFRYTRFVEAMAPCFRIDVLDALRATFAQSRSGWGLDFVWHGLRGAPPRAFAIVDETPVRHTRPVLGGELYADNGMSPMAECAALVARYNAVPDRNSSIAMRESGVAASGLRQSLSEREIQWAARIGAGLRSLGVAERRI
jgi:hypothetical protein